MHAANRLAAHRRLAARPVVVLAPGLAAGHSREIGTAVPFRQHRPGHGVIGGFGGFWTPNGRPTQRAQI